MLNKIIKMKILKEWFIEVPWGKIALISWGNAQGKPVLLVHGRQDSSATFIPLLEQLPRNYFYVGVDLPGHGKSDAFPIGIALTRFLPVVAIDMVVKHLGWKEFFYIGHSMGAEQGLFYNAVHPKQITKLILLDPGPALSRLVLNNFTDFYTYYDDYYTNYTMYNNDDKLYTKEQAVRSVMRARGMTEAQAEVILSRNLRKICDDCYKLSWDKRTKRLVPTNFPPEYYYEIFSALIPPTLYVHANQSVHFNVENRKVIDELVKKMAVNKQHFKVLRVDGTHDVHFINPECFSDVLAVFLNNSDVISKL